MSSFSKTVLLLSTMCCISILKIMLMQYNTVKGLLSRHPLEASFHNWSLLLVELFSYESIHGESLDCTCSLPLILFSARVCIHVWSLVVMTRLNLELKSGNEYVVINSDLNMCKIICSQSGVKNLFSSTCILKLMIISYC